MTGWRDVQIAKARNPRTFDLHKPMKLLNQISAAVALLTYLACGSGIAQQTPPVAPNVTQTPLPPRVELPAPPATQANVPNRPLAPDEAARIALANQPNVTVARSQIQAAQGRTQQARSSLMPLLGLNLGYTRQDTLSTESGSSSGGGATTGRSIVSPGYLANATLQQLLFDFNHTRELVRQAVSNERAAEANLTRVQQDLVLQVKQAFYTYVENESLVGVNESNVQNRQSHLDLAQARLKAGLGLPIDVVRAHTEVSQAVGALESARNQASQSRVNLALLMGIDPRTPIAAAESGEAAPLSTDVNRLTEEALRLRPEVAEAKAVLDGAEHGVSAAKSSNAPALTATAGLTARGPNIPPRNDFSAVGVGIVWDPFDGGLTAGRVKTARALVESARADLRTAQLNVTADVAQAYLNLRTAEQRVAAADAEVANATEAVRLAEGRYRAGVGLFIDVIDAQTALLTSRINRVIAQSAIDQARAALRRAVGTPVSK